MKTCSPGRLGLRAICRDESWTHERKQEFWGRNCRVKKGREPRTEPWRLRRVGNRGSRKGMVKGKERTVVLLMRAHVCRTRSWWGKAARDPGALKPGPVCCGSVRWGGGGVVATTFLRHWGRGLLMDFFPFLLWLRVDLHQDYLQWISFPLQRNPAFKRCVLLCRKCAEKATDPSGNQLCRLIFPDKEHQSWNTISQFPSVKNLKLVWKY